MVEMILTNSVFFLTTAFHIALWCFFLNALIASEAFDSSYQPKRLLMACSTQSTAKSIQSNWTASIKIWSQIIGIGHQKCFQKLKALVTLLLLHLIVTPCFPENGHIWLALPVRVVLCTEFYFSNTRPFFQRNVCQQGFFGLGPLFLCNLTRNLRFKFRLAVARICLATRSDPDEATRETSLGRSLAVVREGSVPRFLTTRCSRRTVQFGSTLSLSRHVGCLLSSKKVLLPLPPLAQNRQV